MLGDSRMLPTTRFSTRPLYLQLRDALAERIAHGEWKPGTAIPNESDLAREFGVSSGTMRKALDMMEAEHLLTRRQGRRPAPRTCSSASPSGFLGSRSSDVSAESRMSLSSSPWPTFAN